MRVVQMVDYEIGTKHADCQIRKMRLIWSDARAVVVVNTVTELAASGRRIMRRANGRLHPRFVTFLFIAWVQR